MSKVSCTNCNKLTPVIPPNYRCKHCDYPLNKEKKDINVNINGPKADESSDENIEINIDIPSHGGVVVDDKTVIGGGSSNVIKKKVKKVRNTNPEKSGKVVAGWLVIHTEGKAPESYELFVGDNYFGTVAEGFAVDIPIKGDEYVSRSHANIQVSKDFLHRFDYKLFDNGGRRPQGPSTNGTFVNGNSKRLPTDNYVLLNDNDTIQVGETKLVFKNVKEAHDIKEAATAVLNSDYTATVILPKN